MNEFITYTDELLNNYTKKQIKTRLAISAIFSVLVIAIQFITSLSAGVTKLNLLLIIVFGTLFIFLELFGFVLSPKLLKDYLLGCIGINTLFCGNILLGAFKWIFHLMVGSILCAIKAIITTGKAVQILTK